MRESREVDSFTRWNPATRKYEALGWHRSILPAWLSFDRSITPTGIVTVAAAGTPTPPTRFFQPYASNQGADHGFGTPFMVRYLVFEAGNVPAGAETTANADYTIDLQEMGEARKFMNRPVHIRTIAGAAQLGPNVGILPARLREPYLFPSNQAISCQLAKVAGAALDTRIYMAGYEYYPWAPDLAAHPEWKEEIFKEIRFWMERRKYVSPFFLTTDTDVNLLALGQAEAFAKIGDNGHFEAFALTAVSTGNFALTISEVKTKQTLMSGQISQTNGIGTNLFPAIFPTPYLVPAGYKLRFQFTDLSGAPNHIFVTLQGRSLFCPLKQVKEMDADVKAIVSTRKVPMGLSRSGAQ